MANNEKIGTKKIENENESVSFVTKILEFFNKYQNIIYGVAIGILVIACALIAFNKFYIQKKNDEASAQIVKPISLFIAGDTTSLNTALEGDQENDGFLDIADGYKLTKTANTAKYYAALTYLKLGQKENAMDYLKKFKKREDVLWFQCQGLIADLYDEQGDAANAIKYYKKAVKGSDPLFTPINLFKLGQMYEREGKWNDAVAAYERIEKDFYTEYNKMSIAQCVEAAKAKATK